MNISNFLKKHKSVLKYAARIFMNIILFAVFYFLNLYIYSNVKMFLNIWIIEPIIDLLFIRINPDKVLCVLALIDICLVRLIFSKKVKSSCKKERIIMFIISYLAWLIFGSYLFGYRIFEEVIYGIFSAAMLIFFLFILYTDLEMRD